MIEKIVAFLILIFKDIFIKIKMNILNKEIKKQNEITKEKVNEANKVATDFLAEYESYIKQRRDSMRQVIEPVRDSSKDTTRSDNGTNETN